MAEEDFGKLTAGEPSILRRVEEIVIDTHRRLYQSEGRPWSKPIAYRWLRFEDPMPVVRLQAGVRQLRHREVSPDPEAVEKACKEAAKAGFPY